MRGVGTPAVSRALRAGTLLRRSARRVCRRGGRLMCGIAGFVRFPNGRAMAQAANRIQQHRGPDAQAVWGDDRVALAHTRLSIIDLDPRSNQPFEKHGLVIVFNGEIYNFRALRTELEQTHGVIFRTASDTEVVLE